MSKRIKSLILLLLMGCIGFSQSTNDSLIQIIKSVNEDTVKVQVLNDLAYELRVSNPDSALLILKESKQLAIELGYDKGIGSAWLHMGFANTSLGNYYEALQQFYEAKSIFERVGFKSGLGASLNGIGWVYNNLREIDKALLHYKQALEKYREINDQNFQASIENNVGYLYKTKGEYDSALYYLNRSLQAATRLNDTSNMYYPLYNIGSIFVKQSLPDSAVRYLNAALMIANMYRDNYLASLALTDLGVMYMQLDQPEIALRQFTNAYILAKATGLKSEKATAAQNMSLAYERLNDTKSALIYLKEFQQINDSLFNNENTRRIALLEAEFQHKQQQKDREINEKLLEAQRLKELNNVKWMRNSFIVGFLLMLVISYLLYLNFARKHKANDLLKILNAQIKEQAKLLKESNEEIVEINSNLERTVEERTHQLRLQSEKLKQYIHSNSHVVRAPLARILALIEMYKTDQGEDVDVKYINDHIYKSANELDAVLREINDLLNEVKKS